MLLIVNEDLSLGEVADEDGIEKSARFPLGHFVEGVFSVRSTEGGLGDEGDLWCSFFGEKMMIKTLFFP